MITCRLLSDLDADGASHMAFDEALLEEAAGPVLRCYAWTPPAVSLGCFQDHGPIAASLPAGMPVVRRITGGGAIWHEHEVTYALCGTLGQDGLPEQAKDLYPMVHGAVLAELARRGASLGRQAASSGDRRYQQEPRCFASPAADDLVAPGAGKVLGSAARARGRRVLLHGSLKTATNPWDQEVAAPCGLGRTQAREALLAGVAAAFGWRLEPGTATPAEVAARARIRQERYGDPGWVERRSGPRP